MDRPMPWVLIVMWLFVGAMGRAALSVALEGRSTGLVWTVGVEATVAWAMVWVAMLLPRITTLTVARIGVPLAVVVSVATVVTTDAEVTTVAFAGASVAALIALAARGTIDAFVDGSSYGPEQRFALRTPALTALIAVPTTWVVAMSICLAPPLAVVGNLPGAILVMVLWAVGVRWAVRSLHLPARRWVVFVPAGIVISDPLVLTDRVLFPRRNVLAIGPAFASTDASDISQGTLGLALQIDLSEPFALPLIDRASPDGRSAGTEKTLDTDRIVFAVLRPGALLESAMERRFTVGETRPAEPQCLHDNEHDHDHGHSHDHDHDHGPGGAEEAEESQTAVPLPRTRSSR